MNVNYTILASYGNQAFQVSGWFSTGIRITFPPHPWDDHYLVNVTPQGQGLSLFASFQAISETEAALYFRDTSGTNVSTEFCFNIPQ